VSQSRLFEGNFAYLRITGVNEGLAGALLNAFERLASTNRVQGVVLDLRYCDGDNYAAAAGG